MKQNIKKANTYIFRLGDKLCKINAWDKEDAYTTARIMGYKGDIKGIRLYENKKRTIRLKESELKNMIAESMKRVINENWSQSQEDRIRQGVGEYASQIKRMLDNMTMTGHTGNNFLRDLLEKENSSIVDKLYDVYFDMQEFAKTTDQRRKEEEDLEAMPPEGWERFGY